MIIDLEGHSDDIVYVGPTGEPHSGELYAYGDEGIFVELSTGQAFHVVYSREGIWRIKQVAGAIEGVSIVICSSTDDESDDYSDVATIACPEGATWCSWATWPPNRHDAEEYLREHATEYFGMLSNDEVLAARRRFQA